MRYQPRCSTLPEVDAPGLGVGVALTFFVLAYLGMLMACIGPALELM